MRTTSGRVSAAPLEGLGAVLGLADDLDVGLRVEDRGEPGPHERLIVGDEDPDHGAGPSTGSRARTPKPPPSRRPHSSVPP